MNVMVMETDAEKIGYIVGTTIPFILVTIGLLKCLHITRRPMTHTICVLSLTLAVGQWWVIFAWKLAASFGEEAAGLICRYILQTLR